jgi:poly(3-hydroxybutyrate) depolymerase
MPPHRLAGLIALIIITLSSSGCGTTSWRTPDGRIATGKINFQTEPVTGRTYHLYVPSSYDASRSYPLVISAHGTFPFDQAMMQRDRWADVAERYQMIVCTPDFDAANGLLSIPMERPAPELLRDEAATLKIIEQLKARYNIRRHATMITGWSGGGYPAHFIGLRHPNLFRCIVSRTANFSPLLVSEKVAENARHMHVYIFYGTFDLPGFKSIAENARLWYGMRGFQNATIRELPSGHDPHQDEAARYFAYILQHHPVVTIKATYVAGKSPRTVRFQALVSEPDRDQGKPPKVVWDFGDRTKGKGIMTTHDYLLSKTYNVLVTVTDASGHRECAQTRYKIR